AKAMCDRHFGIGADGLLLAEPSQVADVRMRMFNPDGSESEMCGNGIRCFGKFIYETGRCQESVLTVETGAGVQTVELTVRQGRVEWVRAQMGTPRFQPKDIPVLLDISSVIDYPLSVSGRVVPITCVSMGNPHAVAFLEEPVDDFPLAEVGPQVEHHRLFPNRTNFEICNILEPDRLRVRVWERGAGLTLACGSGACAVVAAAYRKGLVRSPVSVHLPGGQLTIEWNGQMEMVMGGPAEVVFRGEWLAPLREVLGLR
ncbi:MAG: diaminopimelate epimerase, partial [Chloroflexi bacterium]|nr:diaminopimelate epimerase [Chloroflexota bacterium]